VVPQVPLCFEPNVKSLAPQSCHWHKGSGTPAELVRVYERAGGVRVLIESAARGSGVLRIVVSLLLRGEQDLMKPFASSVKSRHNSPYGDLSDVSNLTVRQFFEFSQ